MKNRAIALLTALVLTGGLVFAQAGTVAPAPAAKAQSPMPGGMRGMRGMMAGQAMPDITPEQQGKIDALRTSHVKAMVPLRADLKVKGIELGALWRADEPDAKKIIAKVKEIGDIQEKLQIARINHQFEVRRLLTPEQRKAMGEMGMGRGMMGRGMGRGMRGMTHGRKGGDDFCGPKGPMGRGGQQGCHGCDGH